MVAQAPAEYKPTEIQTLRLQVKQKDARLAQVDLRDAQNRFNQALADLNAEGEKVKVENKWPSTVMFSMDTLTFAVPAKAEAKKP